MPERQLVLYYSTRGKTTLHFNGQDISSSVLENGFNLNFTDGVPRVTLELIADEVIIELEDADYVVTRDDA